MHTSKNQNPIPPKPPDLNAIDTLMEIDSTPSSFKERLMANESFTQPMLDQIPMDTNTTLENEVIQTTESPNNTYTVQFSKEDKKIIYHPWRFSLIIKLQGKRILHDVLKKKIIDLWRPSEALPLIDLGEDYYIVRFNKE